MAIGGEDQDIDLDRALTGEVLGVCAVRVGGRELLASASTDRTVRLWDPVTSQALHVIPIHYAAYELAWFNDGHLVIALLAGLLAVHLTAGERLASDAERS